MGLLTNLRTGEQTGLALRSYWSGPMTSRSPELARLWSGGDSYTGVPVNEHTALNYSAYWTAVSLIASDVASLPLILYKREKGGSKSRYVDAKLYQILHDEPNSEMSSIIFRETLQAHALTWGNGYAEIERDGSGKVVALWPITPNRVAPFRDLSGVLRYRITNLDGSETVFDRGDMLHIPGLGFDGTIGYSVVAKARESIGLGLATERFGATFFGNGATFGGVLEHPGVMSDKAEKNFRETIAARHQGVNRAHQLLLLEEGMKYQKLGIPPNEAQFIECVAPGTLVSMADGTQRKAEDIAAGDLIVGWSSGPIVAKVAAIGTPPKKILVRVRTNRGREIVTSYDHPFLAKTVLRTPGGRPDTSDPAWTPAGKLAVGSYLRVGLGSPADVAYVPMDASEAYFLGAMVGDGYIRKLGCSFTGEDDGVISAVRASAQRMGGDLVARSSRGKALNYAVATGGMGRGGSAIRTLLNRSGAVGSHADTKRVPEMVLRAGPEAWSAFLSGYLDTDGHVGTTTTEQQPKVFWGSVSRALLADCQHMLAGLGVNSAIYTASAGGLKTVMGQECDTLPSWSLYVTGAESLRAIAGLLAPSHIIKAERLAAYRELPPSKYRGHNWEYDRVTEVEYEGFGETVGIEIEGVHTHVTAGFVTHNSRKFQIEEIARWFRLPPHKIGSMDRATFSNIENQTLDYVRSCLRAWLVKWEQEINRKLISPLERKIQFVEHNLEGLLRGDSAARGEFYRTMFNIGAYSVNMILERENENGIGTDGDVHMAPMNMVPLNRLSDVIDAQVAPKTVVQASPAPAAEPKPTRELDMLNELFSAAVARAEAHLVLAVAADTREAKTIDEKAVVAAERDAERQKFQTAQAEADALRAEIVLTEQRIDREKAEAETRHADEMAIAQRAADLKAAEAAQANLEREQERAKRELAEIEIAEAERRATEAEAERAADMAAAQAERDRIQTENEDRVTELIGKMAALTTLAQEQSDVATQTQAELTAQHEAIEVVRSALMAAATEKDVLNGRWTGAEAEWTTQLVAMREEAEATAAVLALANDNLAATKREIDAGQAALAQMQIEKDAALASGAEREAGLADQIADLQDVAETLRTETAAKVAEAQRVTTTLFELKTIAESTFAELTATKAERDAAAEMAEEQHARGLDLERQIAELHDETRAKEEAAAQTLADLMTLRTVTDATKADLEAAASARDAALAEVGGAIGKAHELEARLADLQAETERQKQVAIAAQAAIVAVEQRAEQVILDKTAAFIVEQRNKEADRLSAMLTAHRALMVDTLGRMVRRETEKARRNQATIPKLRAWMESFYPMFEDSCVESLTPVLRAHLAWMQSGADPGAEALTITRAYIADSRRQLSALLETQPDDLHGSLERLLLRWEQKRPDAVADRLVEEGVAYVRSFR